MSRARTQEDEPRWAKAAVFAAATEAELARQQLAASDIPAAVLNDQTGIFGPGFAGASAFGVTLLVPEKMLEEAREILDDLIDAWGGDTPAED